MGKSWMQCGEAIAAADERVKEQTAAADAASKAQKAAEARGQTIFFLEEEFCLRSAELVVYKGRHLNRIDQFMKVSQGPKAC